MLLLLYRLVLLLLLLSVMVLLNFPILLVVQFWNGKERGRHD